MDVTKLGASLTFVALSTLGGFGVGWVAGAGGPTVLGLPLLLACALLAFVVQWVAYVPAYLGKTERFYDLTGSLTYVSVIALAVAVTSQNQGLGPRALVVAALVVVWAVRLGTFLFRRVHRAGKDGRFDEIKVSWHRFLVAWTVQGLWVLLTALAALVTITAAPGRVLDVFDVVGFSLWALGFGVEVSADRQKARFATDATNRGRFIHTGLWAWSRHPNYAGEIMLWTGLFVVGIGGYRGGQWLAVLSPVFVWALLRFVSGVPILELRADERWGGQPDYEAYKAKTPMLWLWPPRR